MERRQKIILSHSHGNENSRHAVLALGRAGLLRNFYTSIAVFGGGFLDKLSRIPPFRILERRRFDESLKDVTRINPIPEILRISKAIPFVTSDRAIHSLDKKVAREIRSSDDVDAVYAYDEGAYFSFKEAKQKGVKCLFDLPIIHWRAYQDILQHEAESNPEWADILSGVGDPMEKLLRKDDELRMADAIFVASSYTKQTILEYFPESVKAPIFVVPYGFPPVKKERKYEDTHNRRLKFLYVGRLSQSKGLSYMFDALRQFSGEIELIVVGSRAGVNARLEQELGNCTYIPYLIHSEVLDLMSRCDALIFPSLYEGFGMVVTEAMSQGTPVIATKCTCACDFIENGVNGWLVEPASVNSLTDAIKDVLEKKERLDMIGFAAMQTAANRTWEKYEEELVHYIDSILNDELS